MEIGEQSVRRRNAADRRALHEDGGTMFAMRYPGANKIVPNSPGLPRTPAASGLKDFDLLPYEAAQRAPLGEPVDIMEVGFTCAFLSTPYARRLSGEARYVDGGMGTMP